VTVAPFLAGFGCPCQRVGQETPPVWKRPASRAGWQAAGEAEDGSSTAKESEPPPRPDTVGGSVGRLLGR
jgi:hypothetical protein